MYLEIPHLQKNAHEEKEKKGKMAKTFVYRKSTTTTLKVSGFYDAQNMTITDDDGNERDIKTLLSDFEGANIILQAKVQQDEELDEPVSE